MQSRREYWIEIFDFLDLPDDLLFYSVIFSFQVLFLD